MADVELARKQLLVALGEFGEKMEVESRFIVLSSTAKPSVSLALPPVGWQSTVEQLTHNTTVWAWLNTVVILKHPGHLTSMKYEFGD
eukprot:gene10367-19068_t